MRAVNAKTQAAAERPVLGVFLDRALPDARPKRSESVGDWLFCYTAVAGLGFDFEEIACVVQPIIPEFLCRPYRALVICHAIDYNHIAPLGLSFKNKPVIVV